MLRNATLLFFLVFISALPLSSLAQCGQDIDLGTWVKEGEADHGNWVVSGGGSQVEQDINGDPTFYVSPDSFLNVVISGKIRVNLAGAGFVDNDWVGFVFGYSSPDSVDSTDYDFYLFDWKRAQQSFGGFQGEEGFSLSKIDGNVTNFPQAFSGKLGPHVTRIDSMYGNTLGWDFDTDYDFTLTYTNTRTVITIEGDTIFDVYGCYGPGRFGFYNYSQEQVVYSDFSYKVAATFEVVTPDVCLGDSAFVRAVSDSCANPGAQVNNTITGWEWDLGDGTTSNDTNVYHTYANPGTYNVRLIVTDYLGCKDTAYDEVEVYEVTTDLGNDTAVCLGNSITIDAGTNGDNYAWNIGENSQTVTVDSTFDYIVTISNNFGCEASDTLSLLVNDLPDKPFGNDTAICNLDSIVLDAGNDSSSYLWSTTDTTKSIQIGSAATYRVTITDTNGCVNADTIIVSINPLPVVDLGNDTVFCAPDSLTLDAENAGASYAWNIGENTQTIAIDSSHLYAVTVTDGNSCSETDSINVTVNPIPVISLTTNDSLLCFGDTTLLVATGGDVYSWTNKPGLSSYASDSVFAYPDTTTTFEVIVTDSNGCQDSLELTIVVNPLPTLVTTQQDDTICREDSVLLTISGAQNYVWNNAGSLLFSSVDSAMAYPDINTTYTIVATDSNGCVDSTTLSVAVDTLPIVSIQIDSGEICIYDSIQLMASGANTYEWLPNYNLSSMTGSMIDAHPELDTTYVVTGTDNNGCSSKDTVFVEVHSLPVVSVNAPNNVICLYDTTVLTGQGALTYVWNTTSSLDTNQGTSVNAFPTSNETYFVTGTDVNGCSDTSEVSITVNPLPVITAKPNAVDTICKGESVYVFLEGATTFDWPTSNDFTLISSQEGLFTPDTSSKYFVVGTDNNGCQDSILIDITVDTIPVVSIQIDSGEICIYDSIQLMASGANTYEWLPNYNLSAVTGSMIDAHPQLDTTYVVTGTDNNGCSSKDTVFVDVHSLPVVTTSAQDIEICLFDTTDLYANGALTYQWNASTSLDTVEGNTVSAYPTGTETFIVTGRDANGCEDTSAVTVTVNPLPTLVTTQEDDTICREDTVLLTISGAENYLWNNSGSLLFSTVDSAKAFPSTSTIYTIVATDTNGCVDSTTISLAVDTLPVINVTPSSATICLGQTTFLTASGAATYSWLPTTGINNPGNASVSASPIDTTTYTVTGTDANGCIGDTAVTINVDTLPVLKFSPLDTTICVGDTVTVNVFGAASYSWISIPSSSPQLGTGNSKDLSPSVNTQYFVEGTDGNGCSSTAANTIGIYQLPPVAWDVNDAKICLGDTAELNVINALQFEWDASPFLLNQTGPSNEAFPTSTTTFTVTGTDINGCSKSIDTTVIVDTLPVVFVTPSNPSICVGESSVLTANGAQNYVWTDPGNTLSATNTSSVTSTAADTITYQVTGTDANGCVGDSVVTLNVTPLPVLNVTSSKPIICRGEYDTLFATGALSYKWTPNLNIIGSNTPNPIVYPNSTQSYIVEGTGEGGCKSSEIFTVNVYPVPNYTAGPDKEKCIENDTLTLNASGGVAYQWNDTITLIGSDQPNPIALNTVTTFYTVTITDSNDCSFTDQVKVTVNPTPAVDAGPDFEICERESITIGGSPSGSSANSFLWSPGDSLNFDTIQNPLAFPEGTTIYSLLVTNQFGCINRDSMTLTVNPFPKIEATALPAYVCRNDTGRIIINDDFDQYDWAQSEFIIDSVGNDVAFIPLDSATYSVTVTDENGCVSSKSWFVDVKLRPVVTISEDRFICAFDSTQLEILDLDTSLEYTWNNRSLFVDDEALNPIVVPEQTTWFRLVARDTFGCTKTDSVKVSVYQRPYVDAGPNQLNCGKDPMIIGGRPSGPDSVSYMWSPSTGLSDSTEANPIVNIDDRITYTLLVTSPSGCTNSDTVRITTDCWTLYAPTAFSPDGNNINDLFNLKYYRVYNPQLKIWDRFGHEVFYTEDLDIGWDGRVGGSEAPLGVYMWRVLFEDEYGRNLSDEGTVTLVR